ncbi:MAG: 2Fe-2S iron-sulfur cluster-binding protein [Pseudomonadota bacterium]
MPQEMMKVKVFRYEPSVDSEPRYQTYEIPFTTGLSAMDALDYIYQHLDSSLAYYDHAGCSLGICARCTARINGKPGLLCQTRVEPGELTLEPVSADRVIRDLVTRRGKEQT